jgi:hypothetical protein
MTKREVPAVLSVSCDGSEYGISRHDDTIGGPVWMIQVEGHYIGTFDAMDDETEEQVRREALRVIRNGSTSFYTVPRRK